MSRAMEKEKTPKDACFPKSNRLLNKKEFDDVFSRGKRFATRSFFSASFEVEAGEGKLGLIVAKKKLKLAASRNRVKRIVREWYRKTPKNRVIAVGLRRRLEEADFKKLISELETHA